MKGEPDRELRAIIKPIVRGQVFDAFHHHPTLKRRDADSIVKRIVNDLTCGATAARLRAALGKVLSAAGGPELSPEVVPARPRVENTMLAGAVPRLIEQVERGERYVPKPKDGEEWGIYLTLDEWRAVVRTLRPHGREGFYWRWRWWREGSSHAYPVFTHET